jgi:hypothetical protein
MNMVIVRHSNSMESRVRQKSHARFGKRDGKDRMEQSMYGVPVSTSRDPSPSPEDVMVTKQIVEAGKLLDIECLDHIVLGKGGRFVSLKERGLGFQ